MAKPEYHKLLCDLPPSRAHLRGALSLVAALVLAFGVTVPFAGIPLEGTEAAVPAYATAIFINDILTAALLLALFSSQPAPGVLMLACGYLLAGLLAVPWALTFPGVFAESGLLDAGEQTTAGLAALRRLGFPAFVLAYAVLNYFRPEGPPLGSRAGARAIIAILGLTVALVLGFTMLVITQDSAMPDLMAGPLQASGLWTYVAGSAVALYLLAIGMLLARCRSVLDLWLVVVLFALLMELVLLSFVGSGRRLTVGWWSGRAYGLAAASIVLVLMLWETTTLYARLVRSIGAERRARETRLASFEALSASVAHEVNQPLASMVTNADAGLLWLDRPQPQIEEAKIALARVIEEGHRAGKVIEGIRSLFRNDARDLTLVDLNAVVGGTLTDIRRYARLHDVVVELDLEKNIAPVLGNSIQLQQVVSNLAWNGIDAIGEVSDRPRSLVIRTAKEGPNKVTLSVSDTGRGMDPAKAAGLFEPFVTTKPSGLGMGLMICRSIVETHGGRIWVVPNRPRGSVFNVALPVASGPPQR
ncbi:sensor histidine kinase [Enterovirga sp. CN4-39]|uniref:sensor histidine kinase n=1 Tax=Enterovirga sp. CN4-39 TaxID=3400910 RepID=UPI003BFE925B